jgi:hypothetical protein
MSEKDKGLANLIGGGWWGINKVTVKILGLECALWLADMLSKFEYFNDKNQIDDEGFFYNTQENIREDTGLSIDKQTFIIKKLVSEGILYVVKKDIPAKNFYKIDIDRWSELVGTWISEHKKPVSEKLGDQSLKNSETSIRKNLELYNNNKVNNNKGIISSKEDNTLPGGNGSTSSNKPLILKRRKIPLSEKPPFVPEDIKEILTIWNHSGLRKHQDITSKVYKETIHSLKKMKRGVFFNEHTITNGYQERKFTKDEIIRAIENFKLAALNPDYEPTGSYKDHLKKIGFTDFLYNPYSENGERSLFIKYFEAPPKLCAEIVRIPEDEYPEITKILIKQFISRVKGGIANVSQKERGKLIYGSKMIYQFYKDYQKKIDPLFIRTVEDRVELVVDALMDNYKDNVQAGNFCSDYTFDTILPIYLQKQAVLNLHQEGGN